MFYNLKIHSNNSEFSLESEDKLVISREMDLYFSYFFGASEEFNSKIKKIELTNNNVKSIDEIEPKEVKEEVSTSNDVDEICEITETKEETIIEPVIETKDEPFEKEFSIDDNQKFEIEKNISAIVCNSEIEQNLKKEFSSNDDELKFIEEKEEEAKEDLVNENEPIPSDIANDINACEASAKSEFSDNNSCLEEVQEIKDDGISIEKLLNQAQDELNSLDIENTELKNDISEILNGNKEPELEKRYEPLEVVTYENETDEKSNEEVLINPDAIEEVETNPTIYSSEEIKFSDNDYKNDEIIEFDGINENQNQNEISKEVETIDFSNENQAKLDDIFATPSQSETIEETEPIEVPQSINKDVETLQIDPEPTFAQNVQKALEQFESKAPSPTMLEKEYNIPPQTEENIERREINLETNIEPKKELQADPQGDFGDFLQIFDTEKTIDEFLICSYYVKNIANIDSFTMKTINAKLFRSTGKIAGMSVLNELISLGYIKIVDDSDIKKYSITPLGEEYFNKTFKA